MSKHTPGPWAISQTDPRLVKHLSGPVLAECGPVNAEEAQANARLIAAAPDMLDALQSLVDAYQTNFDVMPVAWQTFDNIAQAALVKARGL